MIEEVVAQLKAAVPALKTVDDAAAFLLLKDNPPKEKQPACYVMPLEDSAGGNAVAVNAVRQRVSEKFMTVLAFGSYEDRRGGASRAGVEAVRREIRTALLGFVPEPGFDQILYAGGRMITVRNGVLWWQDDWRTGFFLSKT